ncbi:MAG: cysteinyl-tRNA synthetase [Gaiellaceae bacterium]|jgi:cysteinyl-tRNA synthetase|nr:cysteinyl-tRNA synthetase [Gaiellaceae bacterium]
MRLYNTLSRQLEELPPPPGPIRMYFCGPTVYARAHIGNARPFVVGMWLRSWLRASGYDVTLVHNITDINDKIYEAAGDGSSAELAARATQWYIDDTEALGLGLPDHLPKATDSVPGIVAFIEELIDRGFAYAADGDVYFRVARYPEYGQLSRQRVDEVVGQDEQERAEARKEDPHDFALWKANKPAEDTSWDSPWGRGRPGWHIECSVMAEELLGPAFEIHGGGLDLVFPHHENELAQSRALGHDFARIWTHNGMLRFTGEKMSKSEGNVVTIREALERWGRETVLLFFMTGHWSKPIDFSDETMAQARAQLETFQNALLVDERGEADWGELERALETDFNTPDALAVLHSWRSTGATEQLRRGLGLFGIEPRTLDAPNLVQALASARQSARAAGDFDEADRLRAEIEAAGWAVRDVADGFQLVPK